MVVIAWERDFRFKNMIRKPGLYYVSAVDYFDEEKGKFVFLGFTFSKRRQGLKENILRLQERTGNKLRNYGRIFVYKLGGKL